MLHKARRLNTKRVGMLLLSQTFLSLETAVINTNRIENETQICSWGQRACLNMLSNKVKLSVWWFWSFPLMFFLDICSSARFCRRKLINTLRKNTPFFGMASLHYSSLSPLSFAPPGFSPLSSLLLVIVTTIMNEQTLYWAPCSPRLFSVLRGCLIFFRLCIKLGCVLLVESRRSNTNKTLSHWALCFQTGLCLCFVEGHSNLFWN